MLEQKLLFTWNIKVNQESLNVNEGNGKDCGEL